MIYCSVYDIIILYGDFLSVHKLYLEIVMKKYGAFDYTHGIEAFHT